MSCVDEYRMPLYIPFLVHYAIQKKEVGITEDKRPSTESNHRMKSLHCTHLAHTTQHVKSPFKDEKKNTNIIKATQAVHSLKFVITLLRLKESRRKDFS